MKKILSLLLALALVVSLCGCSVGSDRDDDDDDDSEYFEDWENGEGGVSGIGPKPSGGSDRDPMISDPDASTGPVATTAPVEEVPAYTLYWNADRALYDGKSEAGMSSRMPEADGYFHVRFILDGEEVVLRVAERKVVNSIEVRDLMGLEFDEDGIVIGVIAIEDLPLEKIGWQFYVQSAAKTLVKLNSSASMNGMEVLLELDGNTGIYDMSGKSGAVGVPTNPVNMDRVYAVQNLKGEVTHIFIYERPNFMAG